MAPVLIQLLFSMNTIFDTHISQHQAALQSVAAIKPAIEDAGKRIAVCLQHGNKVLLCGNGGSAADAQHIAAELVGRFIAERKGLPAIALTTDTSILTAVANDYGYTAVFARQVEAHAHALKQRGTTPRPRLCNQQLLDEGIRRKRRCGQFILDIAAQAIRDFEAINHELHF